MGNDHKAAPMVALVTPHQPERWDGARHNYSVSVLLARSTLSLMDASLTFVTQEHLLSRKGIESDHLAAHIQPRRSRQRHHT